MQGMAGWEGAIGKGVEKNVEMLQPASIIAKAFGDHEQ
jgi:hypothetical protein